MLYGPTLAVHAADIFHHVLVGGSPSESYFSAVSSSVQHAYVATHSLLSLCLYVETGKGIFAAFVVQAKPYNWRTCMLFLAESRTKNETSRIRWMIESHLFDVSKGLLLPRHPSEEASIRHKAGSALQPQSPPTLHRSRGRTKQQYRQLHWRPCTCSLRPQSRARVSCYAEGQSRVSHRGMP